MLSKSKKQLAQHLFLSCEEQKPQHKQEFGIGLALLLAREVDQQHYCQDQKLLAPDTVTKGKVIGRGDAGRQK